MERWQNIHTNFVLNCIPKLWLLILPSSYYTFLCKLVMRIWWSIKVISCTWWVWVFSLPVCQIMFGHYREKATSKVVHAFVTTKLDYCSHLYFGLSKYQDIKQNAEGSKQSCSTSHLFIQVWSHHPFITATSLASCFVLCCFQNFTPCLQSSSWTVPWVCLWMMTGVKIILSIAL